MDEFTGKITLVNIIRADVLDNHRIEITLATGDMFIHRGNIDRIHSTSNGTFTIELTI